MFFTTPLCPIACALLAHTLRVQHSVSSVSTCWPSELWSNHSKFSCTSRGENSSRESGTLDSYHEQWRRELCQQWRRGCASNRAEVVPAVKKGVVPPVDKGVVPAVEKGVVPAEAEPRRTCSMMIWKVRMCSTAEISLQASFSLAPHPRWLFRLNRLGGRGAGTGVSAHVNYGRLRTWVAWCHKHCVKRMFNRGDQASVLKTIKNGRIEQRDMHRQQIQYLS